MGRLLYNGGSIERRIGGYRLVGPEQTVGVVNEFLCYLTDRNYSRQTVRAYAFDLLHFFRWLSVDGLVLENVNTDALLRYLTACRTTLLPHQQGADVYSIRDGRNAGYAARTINRRLAALSALFTFRSVRDPAAVNPVPRGREARQTARGERAGLLGHLAQSAPRSPSSRCVSRVDSRAAWVGRRRRRCSEASGPCATGAARR